MNRNNKRPILLASERFLKSYYKSSLNLQHLTEGAVHDLIRKFRSNPRTLLLHYGRLKSCKSRILEIDISGGPRLLAAYSENSITLLEMGHHEIVKEYNDQKYIFDFNTIEYAPEQFFPERKSNFFVSFPDHTVSRRYHDELSSEWIYFLENQQNGIFEDILEKLIYDEDFSAFVIGGPGTGKTCILMNLLKYFADVNYNVGILISDNLAQFIESTTGADLTKYRVNLRNFSSLDVLLVDDPSRKELESVLDLKNSGKIRSLIVAFDPLQLDDLISYQEFNKIVYDNDINVYQLNQCYRQKENLGKNTKRIADIIAASTPFVAEHKIKAFKNDHKKLSDLANNLEFVNPNGYVNTYENAFLDDIQAEVNRIWQSKELMWSHSPGLLVILDDLELNEKAKDIFKKFERINYVKIIRGTDVEKFKGLDYQHVFIFINKSLFDELQTEFKGTGQAVYHKRRLLRIPFSRAKDSLVTFAL